MNTTTQSEPICISGMLAIHAARLAIYVPEWPSLHRFVAGKAPQPVPLAEAEADLLRGWGVSEYVYPVPRSVIAEYNGNGHARGLAEHGDELAAFVCFVRASQARCFALVSARDERTPLMLAAIKGAIQHTVGAISMEGHS